MIHTHLLVRSAVCVALQLPTVEQSVKDRTTQGLNLQLCAAAGKCTAHVKAKRWRCFRCVYLRKPTRRRAANPAKAAKPTTKAAKATDAGNFPSASADDVPCKLARAASAPAAVLFTTAQRHSCAGFGQQADGDLACAAMLPLPPMVTLPAPVDRKHMTAFEPVAPITPCAGSNAPRPWSAADTSVDTDAVAPCTPAAARSRPEMDSAPLDTTSSSASPSKPPLSKHLAPVATEGSEAGAAAGASPFIQ